MKGSRIIPYINVDYTAAQKKGVPTKKLILISTLLIYLLLIPLLINVSFKILCTSFGSLF